MPQLPFELPNIPGESHRFEAIAPHLAVAGDDAVAPAAERAREPAARNIPAFGDLPLPADTANLREGASTVDCVRAAFPAGASWRTPRGSATAGKLRTSSIHAPVGA